jgi:hypothetical protein
MEPTVTATQAAALYDLESGLYAAQHERAAHILRGNLDAAERSADEAAGYADRIAALLNAAV